MLLQPLPLPHDDDDDDDFPCSSSSLGHNGFVKFFVLLLVLVLSLPLKDFIIFVLFLTLRAFFVVANCNLLLLA